MARSVAKDSATGPRALVSIESAVIYTFARNIAMDAQRILVPIALFICATIAFKALLEAVIRMRLMQLGQSEASLRALLDADRFQRRASALRSGIALVALACGAALIEGFGWRDVTPGAVAAVVLPMGVGELIFFFLSQRNSAGLKS